MESNRWSFLCPLSPEKCPYGKEGNLMNNRPSGFLIRNRRADGSERYQETSGRGYGVFGERHGFRMESGQPRQ